MPKSWQQMQIENIFKLSSPRFPPGAGLPGRDLLPLIGAINNYESVQQSDTSPGNLLGPGWREIKRQVLRLFSGALLCSLVVLQQDPSFIFKAPVGRFRSFPT